METQIGPSSGPTTTFAPVGLLHPNIMQNTYTEKETILVLPIDEEFYKKVDTSIHQAIASATEPLEWRLLHLTFACPVPLNLSAPFTRGVSMDQPAHRPRCAFPLFVMITRLMTQLRRQKA
ncbi:hypothetical protein NDU88_008988 [Pleurodeles waltl]|uniref:Uncharacterized protein n=1 Tax=Pleurodeles waltl TaxID=8319 RepID=A0AAV7RVC8_PLEWA|nr:hypothetical protein NDU88_008988 [Pleurodeles waltl]